MFNKESRPICSQYSVNVAHQHACDRTQGESNDSRLLRRYGLPQLAPVSGNSFTSRRNRPQSFRAFWLMELRHRFQGHNHAPVMAILATVDG